MTPLHIASKKGSTDMVVMLVGAGADLHAKDEVVISLFDFLRIQSNIGYLHRTFDTGSEVSPGVRGLS